MHDMHIYIFILTSIVVELTIVSPGPAGSRMGRTYVYVCMYVRMYADIGERMVVISMYMG